MDVVVHPLILNIILESASQLIGDLVVLVVVLNLVGFQILVVVLRVFINVLRLQIVGVLLLE